MKFAFIADIHLSRYGQDKREETTGLPERLNSIKNALYEVGDYCYDNDIGTVVIGGDIYHNKSIVYSIAQDMMISFFEQYEDLEFIIVDGNHDLSGKGQNVTSALRGLSKCHNVEWITQAPAGSSDFLCIPYSHDVVNQVKTNRCKILISHFGLSEGVLNSGMSIISDVSVKDLIGKYELVLLGHYHKPQEIIHDGFKLYYVGSLIQLDWGEKNEEKRFLVVDTDTLNVESIAISTYKRHIEIEVDSSNREQALADIRKHQGAGDHIKVVLKERNVDLGALEVDVRIVDKTEVDVTDRGITSSMSDIDIHKKYMQIKQLPDQEWDEHLKIAMEIVNECEGE